jgi:hypothetical protein
MTELKALEQILNHGNQSYNKTVTDDCIIIQIIMYNDILVFYFNLDETIRTIEEH